MLLRIRHKTFGRLWEMAPAKALCSIGDTWYLVTPLILIGRLPKPMPMRARVVFISDHTKIQEFDRKPSKIDLLTKMADTRSN